VSTFTARPPASDNTENCPSESGQPSTEGSSEKCVAPPSTTQPETHSSEFSLTQVSQAEDLADPPNLAHLEDSSKPEPDQSPAQPIAGPRSSLKLSDSAEHHIEQPVGHPGNEKSTASRTPEKSVSSLDVDTQLAAQGDAFAQYRLGRYYARLDGRHAPEAVSWYKKASPGLHRLAETGNAQAMYVLGVMYAYGRGVSRDPEQARRWLTQAVEHKITAAQPVLANLPVPARTSSHLHAAEPIKVRKQQN
jgi:TPR repeat protein